MGQGLHEHCWLLSGFAHLVWALPIHCTSLTCRGWGSGWGSKDSKGLGDLLSEGGKEQDLHEDHGHAGTRGLVSMT